MAGKGSAHAREQTYSPKFERREGDVLSSENEANLGKWDFCSAYKTAMALIFAES